MTSWRLYSAVRAVDVLETLVECEEVVDEDEQDEEEIDDDLANIMRLTMFLSLTGARHDGHGRACTKLQARFVEYVPHEHTLMCDFELI